jgi:hypothetical protein
MVKSGMMVLAGREKTDMIMSWKLQPTAETVVDEREEKLM